MRIFHFAFLLPSWLFKRQPSGSRTYGRGSGKYSVGLKQENGETQGYAFPATGPGLWGTINAYVGISEDYSELLGLEFIKQDETPGLGGRISEDWYKQQFRGIDLENSKDGNYIIYRPSSGGNVDAIAGATLTSKSVSKLVNEDMYEFIKDRKGGQ